MVHARRHPQFARARPVHHPGAQLEVHVVLGDERGAQRRGCAWSSVTSGNGSLVTSSDCATMRAGASTGSTS